MESEADGTADLGWGRLLKELFANLQAAGFVRGTSLGLLFMALSGAVLALGVGVGTLLWETWIPAVWAWGFSPLTWRCVPAAFGAFYLVLAPLLVLLPLKGLVRGVFIPWVGHRAGDKRDLHKTLSGLMEGRSRRIVLLTSALVGEVLALGLVGVAWFLWIPAVWTWTAAGPILFLAPGGAALVALALLPPALAAACLMGVFHLLGKYVEAEQSAFKSKLQAVREQYKDLGGASSKELVHLMRYASEELDVYYEMGRSQARKSFRVAMLAMVTGFLVLLAGLALRFAPIDPAGDAAPASDVETVVLVSGAIIEFIAVLFLWMYRSTMGQLTYFFDRQMYRHDVLACQWMVARGTSEEERAAVRLIVEKVLDRRWQPERPPLAARIMGVPRSGSGGKNGDG